MQFYLKKRYQATTEETSSLCSPYVLFKKKITAEEKQLVSDPFVNL